MGLLVVPVDVRYFPELVPKAISRLVVVLSNPDSMISIVDLHLGIVDEVKCISANNYSQLWRLEGHIGLPSAFLFRLVLRHRFLVVDCESVEKLEVELGEESSVGFLKSYHQLR